MYKLIELTEQGQVVTETGWMANVQNQAIISLHPLIIVEETEQGFYLVGKKLEGEVFDWVKPKEPINQAFEIICHEGYAEYQLGYVTEDISFVVEEKKAYSQDICEELGISFESNEPYASKPNMRAVIDYTYYEPTKEEAKEYLEILGYTNIEL